MPFRAREGWSWGDSWNCVKPHLDELGYELFIGEPEGKRWNRSAAINAAAKEAGDWDVAMVADADTIHLDLEPIYQAMVEAARSSHAVIPWGTRWKLSPEASANPDATIKAFDPLEPEPWLDPTDGWAHDKAIRPCPRWQVGGSIVIPRTAWAKVGGFDAGFVGWGHEDCAQRLALETMSGPIGRVPGTIMHLWHQHDARGGNAARLRLYKRAAINSNTMRQLLRRLDVLPRQKRLTDPRAGGGGLEFR